MSGRCARTEVASLPMAHARAHWDSLVLPANLVCAHTRGKEYLHCILVQCDAHSGATFSNEGKAIVLVIELSENTADAIDKVCQLQF